jgi:hypothetical protein
MPVETMFDDEIIALNIQQEADVFSGPSLRNRLPQAGGASSRNLF